MSERQRVEALFQQLESQPKIPFPKLRQPLLAPKAHGVYIIRNSADRVLHVGRSVWGKDGLFQRLHNHLQAQSSFVVVHLGGNGKVLRDSYTFQCLEVPNERERALLEHFSTAWHCPAHLGVGERKSV